MLIKQNLVNLQPIRSLSYHKVKNWYGNLVKPKPSYPPYKHVTQIGDPTLRQPSKPVTDITAEDTKTLIKHMKAVFKEYNCVGLSAPQIGVLSRIILIEFSKRHMKEYSKEEAKAKEMTIQPLTVVINPEITITDYTKLVFPESCESIKGFWADVPRFRALTLNGVDENGVAISLESKGWLARIIQHEIDHLNGKLYTDTMDRKSLTCGCWEVINARNGKINLPYGPK